MPMIKECSYYRAAETSYCDLDGGQTTCNGDLNSCEDLKFPEKSDALTQFFQRSLDEFQKPENKEI